MWLINLNGPNSDGDKRLLWDELPGDRKSVV